MKAYVSTSNVALLLHILFTLKNIHHKERNSFRNKDIQPFFVL